MSLRGGELRCKLSGDRVLISGNAVKYLEGTITIDTWPESCVKFDSNSVNCLSIIMKLTGHNTREIFDRYNTIDADLFQ